MGISGLTTFIRIRSERYLRDYKLHDTYLVIDGNSICFQLYFSCARSNCAFGGDYDRCAKSVSDFFDLLLKCNITPLVVFDGAYENKKLKTIISRTEQRIHTASFFCPLNQRNMKFFPIFLTEVFKHVLKEKNIRYMQCLFEADNAIASVAKILNCPVLSYDSDFFIYGSLYVPFDTLLDYAIKNKTGYEIRCKIYRTQYLLDSFKGLEESMLPLAAILLGNDYVKCGTFRNFFRHIKLKGASRSKNNYQQRRIEETFIWLSRYTLDKAVTGILSRLAKPLRQRMLNLIKTSINSYTNTSAEILIPLGFSKDYVAQVNTHHLNRVFKYDEDINSLTYIEELDEKSDIDTNEEEEEEEETEIMNIVNETESMSSNAVVSNLPVWFVNEFLMAKQPTYFLDLIVQRLYICYVQIESYNYSSSITISLKIIGVIFALLKSALNYKIRYMNYMTRGENNSIARYELKDTEHILPYPLPSLSNLREIPLTIRRDILNDTLEVNDMELIDEFPPEWKLYIICIKYWMEQHDLFRLLNSCTYSLFVCMLFHIIDTKIGRYRTLHIFQLKYGKKLNAIEEKRKANNCKPNYLMNVTIIEALKEVDTDDCILAAPFFMSHFDMDVTLCRNPKKFDRFIVHLFAEFQSCLKHGMDLNALLGKPYPQANIANLYNGTLLYNLCSNFQTRDDIEKYVNTVFHKSPSLLRVFNILLVKVKLLFSLIRDGIKPRKKHKKRKPSKSDKSLVDDDSEYHSTEENLDESDFYDPNNPFCSLNF